MRISKLVLALFFVASPFILRAQTDQTDFANFLISGEEDANTLYGYYVSPVLKGMGYGFNNGWYNTAKPHESFGFDLTISMNAAIVPDADQVFEFVESEYLYTSLSGSSSSTLPTLMGSATDAQLDVNIPQDEFGSGVPPLDVNTTYNVPGGIADEISAYTFNQVAVPSPIVQVGLGLFAGTEIKVRWLPTITNDDFTFTYWGLGGLHSISQWIPGLKDIPVDISVFAGYTQIDAEYNIPQSSIEGSGQKATFSVNTLTLQALVSAHVSVITVYGGLGMDNYSTSFKMLGVYDIYANPLFSTPVLTDPITLEQSGNNGFRTTLGARLKLAILTIHADYTFREYNTITAGLGFSVR